MNAILPGWFPTDMTGDLPHTELGEQIRRKTPAGRWGEPRELVGATVFLVDDNTVALTNGGGTRSVAGVVWQVDSDGVWVELGIRSATGV